MRVTLTTDFGTRDPYVAQLKGVLYSRGPSALEVIDLSHEIEPQNVREAALFVRAAWPRFPQGTIHLVVVDPGVGSARRALAVESAGQLALAPDNGVLSLWLADVAGEPTAVAIDPVRLGVTDISATFHGRDLFAPAAALLARAVPLIQLGAAATELARLGLPRTQHSASELRGEIIHIDRFGNLITNITRSELAQLTPELMDARVRLRADDALRMARCYADAELGVAVGLIGSSDLLEIAMRNGSAREQLGARIGDEVSVVAIR